MLAVAALPAWSVARQVMVCRLTWAEEERRSSTTDVTKTNACRLTVVEVVKAGDRHGRVTTIRGCNLWVGERQVFLHLKGGGAANYGDDRRGDVCKVAVSAH